MAGYSEALEQSCSTKAGRLLLLQGCVFLATWHPHVCCHACPQGKGHGIHCEQRIATGAKGKGAKGKSKGKGLWQQPPDFSRFQLPNRTDLSSLRISEDSRERVFLNLQYAEAPVYGELYPLCLDLALPEGQGPFPCVVWCHGGRWLHGSHQGIVENAWGRFLRAQGWAVASVQYRFLQEAAWPACGTDLRRAVLELRQKAPELQLKADLMVAMGHSAGGHLVGLLPSHEPFLDGDRASAVAGIIGVAGAWMGPRNARHGDVRDLLGAEWPPLLALHGTEDELVEPEISQELVAKLQELGVPAELVLLEGHGHNVLPAPPEAFKAVKRFLKSFTT